MKCLLLFFYGCLIFQACVSAKLVDIIYELNSKIGAECNLFVMNSLSSLEFEEAIQQQHLPKFIVSATTAEGFQHKLCSTSALSVVFLETSITKQQQQLEFISHIADHHFPSLMLFVSNEYPNLHRLFDWCWKQRFINVLFLASDSYSLFTYTHFPHLEFFNTTIATYFDHQYAQRNFKGYPIRFSGGIHLPRSLVFENNNGDLVIGGIFPSLLKLFASVHNATLRHVKLTENYTINDCFRLIAERKVDVCAEKYYFGGREFITRPLFLDQGLLLVPCAPPLPKLHYFSAPFTLELWLLLAFTIISLTIALAFISWYRNSCWYIGLMLLDIVACILHLSFRLHKFAGFTQFFLYVQLVAFGFLISMFYAAFLSSILTTHINDNEIEDVTGLKQRNISILASPVNIDIFKIYKAPREVFERVKAVSHLGLIEHQLALDTRYAYFCSLDKCGVILYQQKFMTKPKLCQIKAPILSLWSGILIRNDTVIEDLLNIHLTRSFESGIFNQLEERTNADAIRRKLIKFYAERRINVTPLSMEYYVVPIIALMIGYTIASVAFLCELVRYRFSLKI